MRFAFLLLLLLLLLLFLVRYCSHTHTLFCLHSGKQWGTKRKFLEDPATWWTDFWLKSHDTNEFLNARPSASHVAISQIVRAYPNVRVATQNVDRLHLKSGIDPSHLVEVHGAIGLYRCVNPFVFHDSPTPHTTNHHCSHHHHSCG